jgi:hypothetical protein
VYDFWPVERQLNSYTYPNQEFERKPSASAIPTPAQRNSLQLAVWRSPGDTFSIHTGPFQGDGRRRINPTRSTYDDIGTSYLYNTTWFIAKVQFTPNTSGTLLNHWARMQRQGLAQMRLATVNPSRFVMFYDKTFSLVLNSRGNNNNVAIDFEGEYGGVNNCGMGFLDGSARMVVAERRSQSNGGHPWSPDAVGNLISGSSNPGGTPIKPFEYSIILP